MNEENKMENLSTIPLRRIVDLQKGSYCDRVASYKNLRLTSKALYRALPPPSADRPDGHIVQAGAINCRRYRRL